MKVSKLGLLREVQSFAPVLLFFGKFFSLCY